MRSIPANDIAASPVVIGDAGPWDVLFLVSEISAGTSNCHFNQDSSSGRGQRSLALRFAKGLLSRYRPFFSFIEPAIFLAARRGNSTIGTVFASFAQDVGEVPLITIEYVVVDERFRGQGIGRTLVRAILDQIHPGAQVHCWCTPFSKSMQRLMTRLGFHRARKPLAMGAPGRRTLIPSLWVKQL